MSPSTSTIDSYVLAETPVSVSFFNFFTTFRLVLCVFVFEARQIEYV